MKCLKNAEYFHCQESFPARFSQLFIQQEMFAKDTLGAPQSPERSQLQARWDRAGLGIPSDSNSLNCSEQQHCPLGDPLESIQKNPRDVWDNLTQLLTGHRG